MSAPAGAVFLSHASQDSEAARRLAEALVPDGFREVQWTRLPGGEATCLVLAAVAATVATRMNTRGGAVESVAVLPFEKMRWVEKGFEDRSPSLIWSSQTFRFDPELAAHPRFQAIVERMAFPKPAT